MRRHGPIEYEVFLIGVDETRCEGCRLCADICTTDVFEMRSGQAVPVRPENCLGCKGCVEVCPTQAVSLTEI